MQVLQDYKKFVEYITTKPTCLFEKAASFFRATSDLSNLANFDALITRALADLGVPLQAEMLEAQQVGRVSELLAVAVRFSTVIISKRRLILSLGFVSAIMCTCVTYILHIRLCYSINDNSWKASPPKWHRWWNS